MCLLVDCSFFSQHRHGSYTQNERGWTVSAGPQRRVTFRYEEVRLANRREFDRNSANRYCALPLLSMLNAAAEHVAIYARTPRGRGAPKGVEAVV